MACPFQLAALLSRWRPVIIADFYLRGVISRTHSLTYGPHLLIKCAVSSILGN